MEAALSWLLSSVLSHLEKMWVQPKLRFIPIQTSAFLLARPHSRGFHWTHTHLSKIHTLLQWHGKRFWGIGSNATEAKIELAHAWCGGRKIYIKDFQNL